jgi:hypothetical protein
VGGGYAGCRIDSGWRGAGGSNCIRVRPGRDSDSAPPARVTRPDSRAAGGAFDPLLAGKERVKEQCLALGRLL